MRTFNSACNTIAVSFDTITNAINRTASSLSAVTDTIDNLVSIGKNWSEDLLKEQKLNRDTKYQEMVAEAAIRRERVDEVFEEILANRKERGESFASQKKDLISKIESNEW